MQAPVVFRKCLPPGQPVHPASRAVPVLLVVWPTGHCWQEREAGAGWYWEMGQPVHALLASPEACHEIVKGPTVPWLYVSTMKYTF